MLGSFSYPLVASSVLFYLMSSVFMFFKYYLLFGLLLSFLFMVLFLIPWFKDMVFEGFSGSHTSFVRSGLKMGFFLFVFSEVMLFFSLFWAFFDFSVSPVSDVGGLWSPFGLESFNPLGLPLLNTVLLLSSSITLSEVHSAFYSGKGVSSLLLLTIFLGVVFLLCQLYEYSSASFSLGDSAFGSVFYTTTGLHGMHVLVGTVCLVILFLRVHSCQLSSQNNLWLEVAVCYWHFVDVIWIFVWLFFYLWS